LANYVLGGPELLAQTRSASTSYYLTDAQGSARALTNSSGAVTDTYDYTAFGELLASSGTTANAYLYTGQQFDAPTGLYSLRARYYDPTSGRFLSQDPLEVLVFNPLEINRYGYAGANPVNRIDPSGSLSLDYAVQNLSAVGSAVILSTALGVVAYSYVLPLVQERVRTPTIHPPRRPNITHPDTTDPNRPPDPPGGLGWAFRVLVSLVTIGSLVLAGEIQTIVEGEPQPVHPPEPESSTQPNPDLVYREGRDRPRTMRLYRPQDWQTGMSFWSQPPGAPYLTYRVKVLTANSFMLRFDQAGPLFRLPFFGGGVYMDPSTGQALPVIAGHVSVYHINQEYWTQWYNDEQAYTGSAGVSWQTTALYELREPVP